MTLFSHTVIYILLFEIELFRENRLFAQRKIKDPVVALQRMSL